MDFMELKQKYLNSIDHLLELTDKVLKTFNQWGVNLMDEDFSNLAELKISASQLSLAIFGSDSPFHNRCVKIEGYSNDAVGPTMKGVLTGMRKYIEDGYIENVKSQLAEEFSGDYLEMANQLNDREGLHIAAAVIAGTTLEERVRLLSRKHLGKDTKANGDPDSVENLNTSLREYYTGKLTDQRLVTKEYGIRTEAAHGNWNSDKDDPRLKGIHIAQVGLMISTIRDFIIRNPI
jgi:hypothetical protein